MDLAVGEGNKAVALKKVEDALAQKIHDDANVASEVEAVSQVDAPVPVLLVIRFERGQDSKLNLTRIAIFLDRSNDLDGDKLVASPVLRLDNLAECALPKKPYHLICSGVNVCPAARSIPSSTHIDP